MSPPKKLLKMMKTNKLFIYIVLFFISANVLHANNDSIYVKNLNDCIKIGLENNFSLLMVKNRQQVTENEATAANAGKLPTVSIVGSYGADLHTTENQQRATGDITKNANAYDDRFSIGLNVDWTIFNGFYFSTNYKQLQLFKEKGELETRLAIEDYLASLISEYYNLIQQNIRLENYRYAMSLSKEKMRIIEVRYSIGSYSRSDYLQAKVDFNADSTQFVKQKEVVRSCQIRLNELMANKEVMQPVLTADSTISVNTSLNYDELWESTKDVNASLLIAHKNVEVVEAEYKKIMSRDYPYVKFSAGYGYSSNKYQISATQSVRDWGANAGITVGMTLFDGNRRMQKQNAKLDIDYANLEVENLKLNLKATLNDLWQAYVNNLQIVQMENQNLIAATENYEYANLRYMKGDMSGFEMREAQKSFLDAEERLLVAEYNTKLCEISLMMLSGNILFFVK